jgi:hypothetical protein
LWFSYEEVGDTRIQEAEEGEVMNDFRYDWDEVHKVYEDRQEEIFIQMNGLLGALALLISEYNLQYLGNEFGHATTWRCVRRCMCGADRIRFDTLIPYSQGAAGTYKYPTLLQDYEDEFNYVYNKKPRPLIGTARIE